MAVAAAAAAAVAAAAEADAVRCHRAMHRPADAYTRQPAASVIGVCVCVCVCVCVSVWSQKVPRRSACT